MKHNTDKQTYLQFIKDWKSAVNSEKSKSTLVTTVYTHCPDVVVRTPGWVTGAHHILYNHIRTRKLSTGFTEITNSEKLRHSATTMPGYCTALSTLCYIQRDAKQVQQMCRESEKPIDIFSGESSSYLVKRVAAFLNPIRNSVTLDMFVDMELPNAKTVFRDYPVKT